MFEKLVKQAPSNASYNQWYGVCCFETGDLAGAEKHLKVAVKRRVQDAYRYLGEVYYQTYRFDEAEEMFDEYITLLTKRNKMWSLTRSVWTWRTKQAVCLIR